MMKHRLNLSQVTPGMKLAEPITNASGITLMPAGIRLTPMFIVRLKKWNIDTIDVFLDRPKGKTAIHNGQQRLRSGRSGTTSASLSEAHSEFAKEIIEQVNIWFSNVKDNALMMQLRTIVIKRLVAHGRTGMINAMRAPSVHASGGEGSQ